MNALLLAAGLGTRLRPITDNLPKCLVNVGGKPLLDHWLETTINRLGCDRVIINTHYLSELVVEHISHSPFCEKVKLVHEQQLLGTLNSVKANFSDLQSENVFIAHADNYCVANWERFKHVFIQRDKNVHLTMMTFDTDCPSHCGMVETDSNDRVIKYVEKPQYDWCGSKANGAVFLLDKIALTAIKNAPSEHSDLCKEFLPKFIQHVNSFHNDLIHIDIGTPHRLASANKLSHGEVPC